MGQLSALLLEYGQRTLCLGQQQLLIVQGKLRNAAKRAASLA